MDATFQEEEQLVGEDNSNNLSVVTDLLNQNGVDLDNISELSGLSDFQQGYATSSMNNTLPRRCSERQASKRARLNSELPTVQEERNHEIPHFPPRAVSPLSS